MHQKQDKLILFLERILQEDKNRPALVEDFQNEIWLKEEQGLSEDNPDFLILSELAHDLDYYEPNSKLRQEDSSFFDDEVLLREIQMALRKIQQKKLILRTKRGLVYLNKEEYECLTKFLPENLIMLTQSHAKQKEEKYQLELNDEELDTLRDLVGEQLQILGFDESYDLTEEGKILESLVDKFFIG